MHEDALKRANKSYVEAFECAREWQNVDKLVAGEVIAVLIRANRKRPRFGMDEAIDLLSKLHALSPVEVTETKVTELTDRLKRIRHIAGNEA
jgi:hypothetical protein